jgi:hypothetical protein
MYCAECGCEVDPAAWQCATCGKQLHEPGAMTSTRPYTPTTSKKSKPDFLLGEYLFAILLGVFLVKLWVASEMHRLSTKNLDTLDCIVFGFLILLLAAEILDWLNIYFDRP